MTQNNAERLKFRYNKYYVSRPKALVIKRVFKYSPDCSKILPLMQGCNFHGLAFYLNKVNISLELAKKY